MQSAFACLELHGLGSSGDRACWGNVPVPGVAPAPAAWSSARTGVTVHAFTQEKAPDRTLAAAGLVVSIVTVLGFPAIGSGLPFCSVTAGTSLTDVVVANILRSQLISLIGCTSFGDG
jgi:hypothetical protein